MNKISKILIVVLAGVGTTFIASFTHADRIRVQEKPIYFGIFLAPLLLVSVQRWIMSLIANRWTGFYYLIVWILVSGLFSVKNSNDDIVLANNWFTSVYLGISALVLSMSAVVTPKRQAKLPLTE